MAIPDALRLEVRAGLPEALRVLVTAYPRAEWQGHENFGQLVQFWMQRHMMFRELTGVLREDAQELGTGESRCADDSDGDHSRMTIRFSEWSCNVGSEQSAADYGGDPRCGADQGTTAGGDPTARRPELRPHRRVHARAS